MRFILLCLFLLLGACQSALPPLPAWQPAALAKHPDEGVILELRTGRRLTPVQLVNRLETAPRILLGERHDNADHHALQLWLLQALESRRPQGSLLLEMLTPSQQTAVDRWQAQARDERPSEPLPEALAWQKGWDWASYGPIVRHALAQSYPLRAANLDRREITRLYAESPDLPGSASTVPPVRDALLAQIRESHCGLLPEEQLPAMLAVQQWRDLRMAEALLRAPAPSLMLAGAFHARRDLGVPLHLKDLGDGEGNLQVVILAEAGKPVGDESADFVWYTPAVPEQDHCLQLRR